MRSEAETRLDTAIGYALRIGVSIAALIVFAGLVVHLVHGHDVIPRYQEFHGIPALLEHPSSIFSGKHSSPSERTIMAGILLLIATPLARVILCILGFALEKDRLYVLVSSIVLAVLLYSLFFRY